MNERAIDAMSATAIESAADKASVADILRAQPLSDLSKIRLVDYGRDGEVSRPKHDAD